MKSSTVGSLFAFFSFVFFTIMDIFNKLALQTSSLSIFNVLVLLDLAGLLIVLIFGLFKLKLNLFKTRHIGLISVRGVGSFASIAAAIYSVFHLPLHVFYSIIMLGPLMTAILATFVLKEKLPLKQLFFLLVGFLGVIIVIIHPEKNHSVFQISILGVAIAFIIPVSNAISGLLVRKFLPHENTLRIATYNLLIAVILGILYMIVSNIKFIIPTGSTIVYIIVAGICSGIATVFIMQAFQKTNVVNIVHFQYSQIVFGVIVGVLLFKNIPSLTSIIGISLILLSNFIIIKLNNTLNKKGLS